MINFRVTEQEYEIVRSACAIEGGHGLSEIARRATVDSARHLVAGPGDIRNQLDDFGQKLARVDSALDELVTTLRRSRR